MSNIDQANVSVSLEEAEVAGPPLTAEKPATETAPEPPQAPPQSDEEADPEGTIAASGGVKLAPLGALIAERNGRKEEKAKREALESENATLRQKAEAWDRDKQYVDAARPYIDALRANPNLVHQIKNPTHQAHEPQGPLSAQEAEMMAKDLDLYDTAGKPDTSRAQKIAGLVDKLAERKSMQAVQPLRQTEAQRNAVSLYQHYVNQPEVNGVKVDPKLLSEAWNMVGAELMTPEVAQTLYMNTIGRQILSGHKPMSAPPPPVVHTESVGGGGTKEVSLNEVSQRFRQAAGISQKDFGERRETFKPGQSNSLE